MPGAARPIFHGDNEVAHSSEQAAHNEKWLCGCASRPTSGIASHLSRRAIWGLVGAALIPQQPRVTIRRQRDACARCGEAGATAGACSTQPSEWLGCSSVRWALLEANRGGTKRRRRSEVAMGIGAFHDDLRMQPSWMRGRPSGVFLIPRGRRVRGRAAPAQQAVPSLQAFIHDSPFGFPRATAMRRWWRGSVAESQDARRSVTQ